MPLQGMHEFIATHVLGGHGARGPPVDADPDAETETKGRHGNTADRAMKLGRFISNQVMAYMKWYHSKAPHPPKPALHAWTKAILNTLRTMRWVPLQAEAPVLVRDWCLRTRVDLLVYDAKNRRVMVVEIKTGYADGAFLAERGAFAPPFAHVKNSPRNRAYAQALISLAMLRADVHARYTWVPASTGAWVLCVNDGGVTTCGSAPWSLDFVNHWVRFLQHHGAQRIGDRTLSAPHHEPELETEHNGGRRRKKRARSASASSRSQRRKGETARPDRAGAGPADRAGAGSRGTAASSPR